MKKISLIYTSALICSLTFFSACKKDTTVTGPAGPAGPAYTGIFTGHISLFDQYDSKLFSQLNKVKISIDGTSMSTMTDSTGKFSFPNLSTGTYTLTYSDSTFGTFKAQNIQLLEGTNTRDARLSKIPNFNIDPTLVAVDTITVAAKDSTAYVKLRGTIGADTRARTLIVFVGNTSATSADPATYMLTYTKTINGNPSASSFTIFIPKYDLTNALLTSGSTVYFAVYGMATSATTYEDLPTGRTVYTAISPSAVTVNHVIP